VHTFLPQTFSQYDMFCYVMVFIRAKHAISLGFLQKLLKKILHELISYKSAIRLVTPNSILRS